MLYVFYESFYCYGHTNVSYYCRSTSNLKSKIDIKRIMYGRFLYVSLKHKVLVNYIKKELHTNNVVNHHE